MHTIELLEQAMEAAEKLGYTLRQEYLGGTGGGSAEFGGQKWIFIDLALSIPEQLELVLEALRADAGIHTAVLPVVIRRALGLRRAG